MFIFVYRNTEGGVGVVASGRGTYLGSPSGIFTVGATPVLTEQLSVEMEHPCHNPLDSMPLRKTHTRASFVKRKPEQVRWLGPNRAGLPVSLVDLLDFSGTHNAHVFV